MSLRVSLPRLLPTTVVALGVLLVAKSADMVRSVLPAHAAEPSAQGPAEHQPPAPKVAPPSASSPPAAAASHGGAKTTPVAAAAPPTPPQAAEPPPVSEGERAILLELRQRRQELDARDAALSSREAMLAAAERKITARVDELQALQAKLEALEASRKGRDQASWQGMVKLYEAMKPRDAAAIFNDLDMAVLLPVVDRMKEAKAAAVMAAMQPEKARQVTTELAQMRSRANADPAPAGG